MSIVASFDSSRPLTIISPLELFLFYYSHFIYRGTICYLFFFAFKTRTIMTAIIMIIKTTTTPATMPPTGVLLFLD